MVYLRGDSNANTNNKQRYNIFENFLKSMKLNNVSIPHKTYHHFVGDGLYDSNIDVVLHSTNAAVERNETVICKLENPLVDSHHDIILSTFTLPVENVQSIDDNLETAPRVENKRVKIIWQDDRIADYQTEIGAKLSSLRNMWSSPSKTSFSILLDLSSSVLSQAALSTNKHVKLGVEKPARKTPIPREVRLAQSALKKAQKQLRKALKNGNIEFLESTKLAVAQARGECKRLTRNLNNKEDIKRDNTLFSILSSNPKSAYSSIKASKRGPSCQVPYITVGNKTYSGDQVPDGLFDSIRNLKSQDKETLHSSPSFLSYSQDYHNIMKLSENNRLLPNISVDTSNKLLLKMKPHVADFSSITPLHYINAGSDGSLHFNFFLNDVNFTSAEELNVVYALLLHKGHGKLKTFDRSYRTISTCPFLANALDLYLNDLYIADWDSIQAPTQYQGSGSSHELAAILVTEVIQHYKAPSSLDALS